MTYQDIVNIIRDAALAVNPNGFFVHGRKTDGSLNYNEETPQIILLEPQPNTSNNNSSFIETINFPIIFITQDSPESTEIERELLKQEMYLLSRKLLSKIDEQPLLQGVQYTGGQPEIRQLSGTMTGFSYTLQMTYPLSECSLDFDLPPTIKLFADFTTVVAGATIRLGWIAFNVDDIELDNGVGTVSAIGYSNITIDVPTTFTATATNASGVATDSITISIGNACSDAMALLKDADNNLISTSNIASGATGEIIAPNGTVTARNSNDSYSDAQQVLSGGNATINLPDTTYNVVVNGISTTPFSLPTLEDNIINIIWTN